MPKNPDYLMSLKPVELKSLNDGDFKIYCGMKFEAIDKTKRGMGESISRLDRHVRWILVVALLMFAVAILSVAL